MHNKTKKISTINNLENNCFSLFVFLIFSKINKQFLTQLNVLRILGYICTTGI